MTDLEYQRARRQAIKDGTWVPKSEQPKLTHAEYMRAYRASRKPVAPIVAMATPVLSEAELMFQVRERGKVLSAMMRTHPDHWLPEWTADLGVDD